MPFVNNQRKKVIRSSQERIPAIQLVRANPNSAAVISKLVQPREHKLDPVRSATMANQTQVYGIAQENQRRLFDNQNILQIFPELDLGQQILISSILSPKDMVNTETIYRFKKSTLPPNISASLTKKLSEEFETEYCIKDLLPRMLRDMLFETGSYASLVVPEGAVDQLINSPQTLTMESLTSMESMKNTWDPEKKTVLPRGILGDPDATTTGLSFESHTNKQPRTYRNFPEENGISLENLVEVNDNPDWLKMPKLLSKMCKESIVKTFRPRIKDIFPDIPDKVKTTPTTEAFSTQINKLNTKVSDTDFHAALFKRHQGHSQQLLRLPDRRSIMRASIGRPLVQRWPSESVIPVCMPGDEENPVGFFLPIDQDGQALSIHTQSSALSQAQNGMMVGQNTSTSTSPTLTSLLIQKAKMNLAGNMQVTHLDQITDVYAQIVEQDLIKRLRNGKYGVETSISKNQEVYRMMMARSMCSMMTKLLYVPKELFSYFAFKRHSNGVGKSLIDDVKMLCSMRAILLFARVQAEAKSSIAITDVSMELDPRSPDPMKDIEEATDLISRTRQQYFPLGTNSPNDLLEWIHRAGFQLNFSGHPGLPQTKFSFETKNFDRTEPNTELDESLKKQTYMALCLQPEVMESGFTGEFATTTITNNILLTKRIVQFQESFSRQLSIHCQKIVLSDMEIIKMIATELKDQWEEIVAAEDEKEQRLFQTDPSEWKEQYIERLISELEVAFPKPELAAFQTQFDAFKLYDEAVEAALPYWLSGEIISEEINGQISGHMESIKKILKAHFMRDWMARECFMPELADIINLGEDNLPKVDIFSVNKDHMEALILNSLRYIKNMTPMRAAANKDLEKLAVDEGSGGGGSYDSSSSDSGSSDSGDGGDGFGDFSFDDGLSGGGEGGDENDTDPTADEDPTETPPEEETPA